MKRKRGEKVVDHDDNTNSNSNSNSDSEELEGNDDMECERHCELCGGGNDGKPPLKHIHYHINKVNNDDGFGDPKDGWLGHLIAPIHNSNPAIPPPLWVHYQCILWSPEVPLSLYIYISIENVT